MADDKTLEITEILGVDSDDGEFLYRVENDEWLWERIAESHLQPIEEESNQTICYKNDFLISKCFASKGRDIQSRPHSDLRHPYPPIYIPNPDT